MAACASSMPPPAMGEAGGLVDLAAEVEDGQSRDRAQAQQDAPDQVVGHMPEASNSAAMSGPTISPAPCMANTRPTILPRVALAEYSLMIVALTG